MGQQNAKSSRIEIHLFNPGKITFDTGILLISYICADDKKFVDIAPAGGILWLIGPGSGSC
jgi:hypothetical protein